MRPLLRFVSFSLLTFAAGAQAQEAPVTNVVARTLTLNQAVEAARVHQPQLHQAQASTEVSRARVQQAFSGLLPQVTGTAAYNRSASNSGVVPTTLASTATTNGTIFPSGTTFRVTASELVWDFGQTPNRYRAAKANAQSFESTEQATLLNTLFNVRNAYFNARANKGLVAVAQETLANEDKHLAQIQGFVEVGTRPAIDLAQARTDRSNALVQLINAQNNYDVSKAQLNQAMGLETTTDYDVIDEQMAPVPGEDLDTDALVKEASSRRPELAALEHQVNAQQLTVSSVQGGYWPTVGVSTSFTESGPTPLSLNWNWNAIATLSWALFQGGYTRGQVQEAEANLASLQAQVDIERQQIRLDLEQARLSVQAARKTLDASEVALVNAKDRYTLAEGRYQTGVGSIIELGDAQVALSSAGAQKVSAEYRLAAARAQLIQALGLR